MLTRPKRITALLLLLASLSGLGGCSGTSMGSDSLLRPPRATGDKAAIQDIISAEAGGSYTLKYPQKGENRSAIMMRNIDTDSEYALALYSTDNDTKLNVSIITYSSDSDTWKCIGTYSNTGSGVDRVMFSDINGDKNDEIIIGWTSYNSAQKSLTAYSFKSEEAFEMVIDETYDELVTGDLTGDQTEDLLLLSLSTQEKPSMATLLQYSETDKRPVGTYSLPLDSEVIAFSNIMTSDVAANGENMRSTSAGDRTDSKTAPSEKSDGSSAALTGQPLQQSSEKAETSQITSSAPAADPADRTSANAYLPSADTESSLQTSDQASNSRQQESSDTKESSHTAEHGNETSAGAIKCGVIIDGRRSDNTFCTQMVCYDAQNDVLRDPVNGTNESTYPYPNNNPTQRSEAIFSRDINNDGVIEIPIVKQMSASVDENGASVCNQVEWNQYSAADDRLNTVLCSVMNLKDGYYVVIPKKWNGSVTARSNAETRELTFYLWNDKTSSLGDKLLTIGRFTEQQWNKMTEDTSYHPLGDPMENTNAVIAAQIFHTDAQDDLNITEDELSTLVFAI